MQGALGTAGDAPASRSTRRRSPSSTVGVVRSRAYAISLPVHQPFIATVMPPSAVVAQNVIAYSTQLAAAIATRSPLPTPYFSDSVRATAATGPSIDA